MYERARKFYHDADLRRELIYDGIQRLLKEHSMNQSKLVAVLRDEFGFTKMTPSLFSKMFSPKSSQKQTPELPVICAIAEYFNVPVGVILEGGSRESVSYDIRDHITYRMLCQLLYWMDEDSILEIEGDENVSADDARTVKVLIRPGEYADDALAHFLSMYLLAKKSISTNTIEGRKTQAEFIDMLINACPDREIFPDYFG